MKSVLAVLAIVLAMTAVPVGAQESRIAAVVNDDVISVGDVEARTKLQILSSGIADSPQVRQRMAPLVLRALIEERLQLQETKRLNIAVTEREIDEYVGRLEQQNNLPKGGVDKMLAENRIDKSALVSQITAQLAWGKLIRRRLAQSITISDEEIDEMLARLKANENQPQSRVSEIFLAVDIPQQEDEVRRLGERLLEQIRAGAPFTGVARQFSQSATAAVGGDIGWVSAGQLNPDLDQAIAGMRVGEVSQPIRSVGGFYLLQVRERRTPGGPTVSAIAAPTPAPAGGAATVVHLTQVVFPLAPNASDKERDRAVAQARQVGQSARSCSDMNRIGREKAPQLSGDIGRIKIGDLPPELRPAILALAVNQPSPPLPVRGGVGVLMVCARQDPPGASAPVVQTTSSPPPALPSREEVRELLSRQRLEGLARRYLRDLRRTAFVDIRG